MELSEKLRLLRIRAKLSQSQVGERVGKDYSAIARYERGDVKPKIDVLQRIAGVFGMSLDQFYTYNLDEEAQGTLSVIHAQENRTEFSPSSHKVTVLVELDGTDECMERWIARLRQFNATIATT
ncbi:helix-turn-helix domain-containing protein [Hymenobacter glacieicola]|uniref:HTH cro/C1-type domain-containing protein n=1 Tax=Hymenobacter glacieicola TaxID=1562124 RepID=A0ABQ1X820_9BACT|nr:helix-turn-helix transcriptional regulator [Hymenobacter glacieicola]GGG60442.1 hypothetical protein GCM10011378_40540 [Hymenobacter glacieicola]